MSDKRVKVTIFYKKDTGELYAYSENKEFILLFETTRNLSYFIKRKVTMSEEKYKAFLYIYRDNLLMMNVLTDGIKSYDFITTYEEDQKLSDYCDKVYDKLMMLERDILPIPLNDRCRKCLGNIISEVHAKEGKFGKFNTFQIFIHLFKDSIL